MSKSEERLIEELKWEIVMLKVELKTRKRLHTQRTNQLWDLIPDEEKTLKAQAIRAFKLLLMNRPSVRT